MILSNLSQIIAERNMTMSELSSITGMSKTTLTALTNNTGKGIQFETLDKLCQVLEVTPNQFFDYEPLKYTFHYISMLKQVIIVIHNGSYTTTFKAKLWILPQDKDSLPEYVNRFPFSSNNAYDFFVFFEKEADNDYFVEKYIKNLKVKFRDLIFESLVNIIENEIMPTLNKDLNEINEVPSFRFFGYRHIKHT